ncbi:MAG: hypothetical protein LBG64_03465 [Pseudomonadales bacterium]|jgi:hypothetical protein|nr:hypothetical protein [Pseudomonadales bacterium]
MKKRYQIILATLFLFVAVFFGAGEVWGVSLERPSADMTADRMCATVVPYIGPASNPMPNEALANCVSCAAAFQSLVWCLEHGLINEDVGDEDNPGWSCTSAIEFNAATLPFTNTGCMTSNFPRHAAVSEYISCLVSGVVGTQTFYNDDFALVSKPGNPVNFVSSCINSVDNIVPWLIVIDGEPDSSLPSSGFAVGDLLGTAPDTTGLGSVEMLVQLCNRIGQGAVGTPCRICADRGYLWTAVGCINTGYRGMASNLTAFFIGVAGLFFVLQIAFHSFKLISSAGNPQAVSQAREGIISSVFAILFIVFSVFILNLVGISIFRLPGFFDG